ncbi:MAG TPA: dethiobiotin synthase [Gammaproteobacteria bacterium]
MSLLFVTGSGTDVGKTYVTALLARQLRHAGRTVAALKPVATGFDPTHPAESDPGRLLLAVGVEPSAVAIAGVSPWRFAAPLSPDMAAAREGRAIDFEALVAFCARRRDADVTLIEGIGGVMVPLDGAHTVRDWIAALRAPALLVTGSYLGTLSHTLTAVEALRRGGCRIAGIVVSESAEQPVPADETAAVIARFTSPTPVRLVRRGDASAAALLDLVPDR